MAEGVLPEPVLGEVPDEVGEDLDVIPGGIAISANPHISRNPSTVSSVVDVGMDMISIHWIGSECALEHKGGVGVFSVGVVGE